MQLKANALNSHLKTNLLPVYLVSGDVPLLAQECRDSLRQAATRAQFLQRERLVVERGFKWSQLTNIARSLSLFSDKTIIEVYNPDAKFDAEASKLLVSYCDKPPTDKILVIICGKLTAAQLKTRWCKAIDKVGAIMRLWPIKPQELPAWLQNRARAAGITLEQSAIKMLAELTEGNLLAAQQAIDKLRLLFAKQTIGPQEVASAISNSARYNVFDLSQPLLEGNPRALLRTLKGLREEACEPTLVLWLIARELRLLVNSGGNAPSWSPSAAWQQQALRRSSPLQLKQWLYQASFVDQIIKGFRQGDAWSALTRLALTVAGANPLPKAVF